MSFGAYLAGLFGLVAVVAPLAFGAVRLRARILPGWSGAPARLAEAVLAIAALTALLQVLAVLGILEPGVLAGSAIALGVAGWRLSPPGGAGEGIAPPAPAPGRVATLLALAAAAFLAAHWATGLQDVWARGMLTFDTLWYHGPFAARIAAEGSVSGLHFTDPLYLNWFYPQNSELQHAAGIVLFDRDLLSPLLNFGWLGLALLAAWCIGRPYGVAPLSLVAVALVLDTGPMVPREAGTPANDVAPVALLLAAAAILINAQAGRGPMLVGAVGPGPRSRTIGPEVAGRGPTAPFSAGALIVAGLAIGLALGTKLTIAGAALAMAVGVPFIVPKEARRRALLLFLGGVAVTAGFWFVRNIVHSGSPLPWLNEIGPIDLPGPDRGLEGRDPYSVAHYIFVNPDTDLWSSFFFEPIKNLFGPGWALFLGLSAVGALLALLRPRSAAVRLCGAVTIAAAIAYLFTPLTAAGPEGEPLAFSINLRYLVPGLALGLALLPLEPRLTRASWHLPLLVGGLVVLVVTSQYSDSATIWDEPYSSIPAAALIGVLMVGVPVGLAVVARRSRWLATGAGVVLAVAVAAAGWERQDDYFQSRYDNDGFRFQIDDAIEWAKPTEGLRIAVAGTSGAYNQYGLYGDELDNHVQYVGREAPGGDFREITKCGPWRRAVNDGDFDYVVTTPSLDLNDPASATPAPERGWLRDAEGAEQVTGAGRVAVFRLEGELDPRRCSRGVLAERSESER